MNDVPDIDKIGAAKCPFITNFRGPRGSEPWGESNFRVFLNLLLGEPVGCTQASHGNMVFVISVVMSADAALNPLVCGCLVVFTVVVVVMIPVASRRPPSCKNHRFVSFPLL